jgi:hypothetical protein
MDPDSQIDAYIRENRGRYTREAVRQQLIAAGHAPEAIDAAWERVARASPATPQRPAGWRPGWREFLILLVVGAIGAAIVWANEPYGAGAIAPVVYAVILSVGFGVAKLISILVDRGNAVAAAVILAILAVGAVYLGVINSLSPIALAMAAIVGVLAVLLVTLGPGNRRLTGMIGAGLPILVWLVVTGTCFSPLLVR